MPERRAALDALLTAATDAEAACRARCQALEEEVQHLLHRTTTHPDDRRARGQLWTLVEEHRLAVSWGLVAETESAAAARAVAGA